MEDDNNHRIASTTPAAIEINENIPQNGYKESSNNSIKTTKILLNSNINQEHLNENDCDEEEDGIPAPIVIAK